MYNFCRRKNKSFFFFQKYMVCCETGSELKGLALNSGSNIEFYDVSESFRFTLQKSRAF